MRVFLVLLLIGIEGMIYGQGLTKNAEGESTVMMPGASIGIDIGKTQLGFAYNNLQNTIAAGSSILYGASVTGENKEGISNLFKEGEFVPAASLDAILGYCVTAKRKLDDAKELARIEKDQEKYVIKFADELTKRIMLIIVNSPIKAKDKLALSEAAKSIDLIDKEYPEFEKLLKSDDPLEQEKLNVIKAEMLALKTEYYKEIESFEEKKAKIRILGPQEYWQVSIFSYGGIQGSEFKRFEAFNMENLSESFIDESFRGGRAGAGVNAQWRFIHFGLKYGYFKTNNFDLLTKKEYSLKNSVSSNGQTITEDKKVTAYTGSYGEVEVNELNMDLIFNLPLDPKAKNHILINPYMRAQLMSRNAAVLPNSTNLGLGFYFFKNTGNFLGGFYTELADVNNNYEKAKAEADRNLRAPLERMSFGIVAKFSFKSLLY